MSRKQQQQRKKLHKKRSSLVDMLQNAFNQFSRLEN